MSQYVYFALRSETVPATEVTAHLGLEPDRERVRGETRSEPALVPAEHTWALYCTDLELRIDEQIESIIRRLRPVRDAVHDLVRRHGVTAAMVVVRHFNDIEGVDDLSDMAGVDPARVDPARSRDGGRLSWLTGEHPLLGWRLSSEQLAFLASLGADVVAEEHG